jgi:hypothetical protein
VGKKKASRIQLDLLVVGVPVGKQIYDYPVHAALACYGRKQRIVFTFLLVNIPPPTV